MLNSSIKDTTKKIKIDILGDKPFKMKNGGVLCSIGKTQSGKSELVKRIISNICDIQQIMPYIVIIGREIEQWRHCKFSKFKNTYLSNEISAENIKYAMNLLGNRKTKKNYDGIVKNILVLDDFSSDLRKSDIQKELEICLTTCRHKEIFCFVIAHYISNISPCCRAQVFFWFIFNASTENLKLLYDSLQFNKLIFKNFVEIFKEAIKNEADIYENNDGTIVKFSRKKHNFMYIDTINQIIYRNFTTILYE